MAFTLTLSSLSIEQKREILKTFTVSPKKTQYCNNPPIYRCFIADKSTDTLHLPYGMWKSYIDKSIGFPNGDSKDFPKMNSTATFAKELYTPETDPTGRGRDQPPIIEEALKKLKNRGYVFMALYTGMGKTALAIYLSIVLGLKTVVLCHLDVVRRQWPEEYNNFSGGSVRVQFVEGANVKLDPFADVYVIGIQKATKMNESDFIGIGTVIVDESHITTVKTFTECLFKFHPRNLIGLSGTPDRPDGLHSVLNLYFGDPNAFIVRKEKKTFTVYKYKTKYKPHLQYVHRQGKVVPDWHGEGGVIDSIERNEERWKEIVNVCIKNPNDKIIVLCMRNVLSNGVYNLLLKMGEDAELLIGNTKKWNKDARILVAGFKKGGVGMNDPKLTMAIICSDTSDSRQLSGRIRTNNNKIYHFVDDYKTFEKHYLECEKFYIECGATIETVYGNGMINNNTNTNDEVNKLSDGDLPQVRYLTPKK
jgi:hypothetical protein